MNGFLESLRTELLYTGVNVMTVAPGFTASNIRNKALDGKGNPQKESPLEESQIMSSETCAQFIFNATIKRKKSLILTNQGKLTVLLNKLFPRWMDKKVFQHFKNEPNSPLKG
jgi:short-subunit dehydrogenase